MPIFQESAKINSNSKIKGCWSVNGSAYLYSQEEIYICINSIFQRTVQYIEEYINMGLCCSRINFASITGIKDTLQPPPETIRKLGGGQLKLVNIFRDKERGNLAFYNLILVNKGGKSAHCIIPLYRLKTWKKEII